MPTKDQVHEQLATVNDPEIDKPITELGMVADIAIEGRRVGVQIKLTIPGCPLKDRITREVTEAVMRLDDVDDVQVAFGSMTDEERQGLSASLRAERGAANPEMDIPFAAPDSQAHGCKVISIGFFTDPDRSVIWRGPMLHRALQQFLGDVHWGELDFLLCDLPPGTGDIAISLAQMLPNADMVVVTTPQQAAQKVALRAGKATEQTGMKVTGVIENMAGFTDPETGATHDIFGTGGGQELAEALGTDLLGTIPIDPHLREAGDAGVPLVVSHPDVPASIAITSIATGIAARARSIVGRSLPLNVS
ncbi:MAG: Mrp/NBP35 family ATP-binding protein [Intrasporangiaceae bacterium]|nr:Mrp/NBP35 family ATP-binding protein [Intrasporangiaceae bacterium]